MCEPYVVDRSEIEDFAVVSDATDATLPDELDHAFMGFTISEEEPVRAVYSVERCIAELSKTMSDEEASEYFWYNVAGSLGEDRPIYITTPEE